MFHSTSSLTGGTLTGRFVRHTVKSDKLGSERGVTVRLPDGYDSNKSYPVVYLQDGQNMFDRRSGFMGKEWHVDETVAQLTAQGALPEAIYVAVDNGGGNRLKEYTHVADPDHGGGQGKQYEDFFLQELIPAVDTTYASDQSKRFLMGSSLGGLVSLAMTLNNPGTFAAAAALSPSLWWSQGQLSTHTLENQAPAQKPRLWIDMGTEEGGTDSFGQRAIENGKFAERPSGSNEVQDVRDRSREMGEALLKKGWQLDRNLRYHEPLGGTHTEESWAQRSGEVLSWMLK